MTKFKITGKKHNFGEDVMLIDGFEYNHLVGVNVTNKQIDSGRDELVVYLTFESENGKTYEVSMYSLKGVTHVICNEVGPNPS